MSTHKNIDRICAVIMACVIILTVLFINGEALGIQAASAAPGYADRLFDTGRVHTIDIVMDDWDGFIETCENEEYALCAVVIDGEAQRNVGIRAKGNTSLSTVSSLGSDRYSFKIEFDQYDSTKSYYGLDKLCLNNVIQDTTYMKDYLVYRMMADFGVDAPLCSYAWLTVNGEDWGLYLAVEGVEDAFLQRNYGRDYGELYKPDSSGFGGGRGNGQGFDMADFLDQPDSEENQGDILPQKGGVNAQMPGGVNGGMGGSIPGGMDRGGMGGGMGSSDVKLQYVDDDPDSYTNIFDNAKTNVSEAGQTRLIQSLKALGEGEDIENVVNIEEVLRYFVVHNFVVNGDSYTGSMVHNYYLYEDDGWLSMIPWDYNLAFGTFQGNNASSAVNDPIDTPLSVTGNGDRPMANWIFSSEEYTQLYHQYFAEFLESTDFSALIDETAALIDACVEKDPTKFYSYEEFQAGVAALKSFCLLRAESVAGQLNGTIPSTSAGQSADQSNLVNASGLTLSDMGAMNNGGGMGGGFRGGNGDDAWDGGALPAGGHFGGGHGMQFPDEQAEAGVPGGQPPFQQQDPSGGGFSNRQDRFQQGVQDGGPPAGIPDGAAPAQPGGGSGVILLAASIAVLLVGLVIAFKFKYI